MAYTNSNTIRNYLQRELTDNEVSLLVYLIPAIQKWIDKKTSSTFDEASSTSRQYNGEGLCSLSIDPCTAVTAVKVIDQYEVVTQTYEDYEYTLEPLNETVKKSVRLRNGVFPNRLASVQVTALFSEYDEGVPDDITMVATKIAADVITQGKMSASGEIVSESLEGHSITYRGVGDFVSALASADPMVNSILELRRDALVG